MKKKKLVTLLTIGVVVLSCLVGCSKEQTEQEKLAERINNEIEEYEQNKEEQQQQNLEMNEIKETFNNYKTQLSEVIDEFHTGDENTDYQEISDRYVSLYNEVEEYLIENEQIALLDNIYLKEIEQRYVDFKVNYLSVSSEIDFDYNYINYVQDEDTDKYILILEDSESDYISCVFIFEDGRTCLLDTSSLLEEDISSLNWGKVTETTVELNIIKNADWLVYSYDVTGNSAIQTGNTNATSDSSSYYSVGGTADINGVNLCVKKMMGY